MKTIHTAHGGKLSLSRASARHVHGRRDRLGSRGGETRIGGLQRLVGSAACKEAEARAGDVLAFGRMEGIADRRRFATGRHAARGDRLDRAARAGLRHGDRHEGPQGRRAPQRRARQAGGGGSRHSSSSTGATSGELRLLRPGRSASARVAGAARQPLRRRGDAARPRGRLSRDASATRWPCAAATRSRPAATASSATSRIEVEPLPRGSGFEFVDRIVGRRGAAPVHLVRGAWRATTR